MTEYIIEQKSVEMLNKIKSAKPVLNITGTTYYVSNGGDDANDGLSSKTAWKTIERVNAQNDLFKSGDAVLFRCGDVFRGSVEVRGITYSNYGEGEKPHFYAAPENAVELDWKDEGNDIYSLTFDNPRKDIGNIVFNHGETYAIKKWRDVGLDLEFDLDFYHNLEEQKLYLKSTKGNPKDIWYDIELCVNKAVFWATCPNCDNSTFDGLVIKYSGACSMSFSGTCVKDNVVRNCEFEWIGGSIMRPDIVVLYGNAYQIWGGCDGVLIENCYFNQSYDAAVTPQWFGERGDVQVKNFVVRNCLFERNTYDFEYFLSQFEPGTTKGDHKYMVDSDVKFINVLFEENICRKNGYGFGAERVGKNQARCVRCGTHANLAENFVIRNNIFDRSAYTLVGIYSEKEDNLPVLEGNTYCQHAGKGFIERNLVLSSSTREIIKDNTIGFAENDATVIIAQRMLDR